MPGTGKHGYTGPALYGGSYGITNGIITSGSGASPATTSSGHTVVNRNSPYGRDNVVSDGSSISGSGLNGIASNIAGLAGMDTSDYGDYLREALDIAANNTAMSQAFAREQMEYQRQSDATAMAWSAAEAQKNRDWQERLSNTAHVREVKDLLAAGLNPILSANNGAFTGSGATGQGFSSSGAMGQVDTSANGLIGQLASAYINTASQAAIAGMYTDAQRYQADMAYAQSKMNVDANLLMNDKNITSNEKINKLNSDTALQNANTAASANMAAAGMTAGATVQASMNNLTGNILGHYLQNEGVHYQTDKNTSNSWNVAKLNSDTSRKNNAVDNLTKLELSPYATAKGTLKNVFGDSSLKDFLDDVLKQTGKSRKF